MLQLRMFHTDKKRAGDFFCYDGLLTIGKKEIGIRFFLSHWSLEDYLGQWKEGIERIKNHEISCLITGFENAKTIDGEFYSARLSWIVLYKNNNRVLIQKLAFYEEDYDEFVGRDIIISKKNYYEYIPEYSQYYPMDTGLTKIFWQLNIKELSKKLAIVVNEETYQVYEGWPTVQGSLSIGNFTTNMYIPTKFWSISEYKQQWKEGVDRLKNHSSSCLVIGVLSSIHMNMVLLYKRNEQIYFYFDDFNGEHYPEKILDKIIRKENCYDFIPDEQTHLEKYRVKEWEVDLKEFDGLEIVWPEK